MHADYFDSNGNSLGQISLFHADELRNDGDTPVHLKLTTNHANLISYARNYFSLGIDDIVVVYPTQIEGSIESNSSYFYVNANAYEPQNSTSSYEMSIPYLTLNPLLPLEGQTLEVAFGDIEIPLSSTTATLSNGRQKIDWLVRHSYGITGTHGDYTTNSGFSFYADYGYHGENSSAVECYLTGRANMGFTVYVEEPVYEIFHQYTFTTRNTSLLSPVSVLP